MRTTVLTLMASILLPLTMSAQDDLYFAPTKKAVKAQQDAYDRTHGNYHIGRDVSVDEYNRRNRKNFRSEYVVVDGDSALVNDIIDFTPRPKDGSDTLYVDTVYDDKEDFQNSYQLSRWDDYYCGYRPWFRPYNYWGTRYYGWYDPWYRPYWNPWYDPWFDPWYGPGYWAWDPWFYDPWYGPYYGYRGWYDYPYGHGVYIGGGGNGRLGGGTYNGIGARTGTGNHHSNIHGGAFAGAAGSGNHGSRSGSNYSIASRNGNAGSAAHSSSRGSWGGSARNYSGGHSYSGDSRSYSGGGSSYSGGGSSYSGGGSSYSGGGGGFGGSSGGGGGHSSGGSSGGGGGHFGGGR